MDNIERARSAMFSIPPDLDRASWVKVGMAAHAAGLNQDDFIQWSEPAPNFNLQACRATWRSFKHGKGVDAGSLFFVAKGHGWNDSAGAGSQRADILDGKVTARFERQNPKVSTRSGANVLLTPKPLMDPAEIYERCLDAPTEHEYIMSKCAQGVSLDGLKVEPAFKKLKLSKEDAKRIVNQCQRAGWIAALDYRTPDRKPHQRWTVTAEGRLFMDGPVPSAPTVPTQQDGAT